MTNRWFSLARFWEFESEISIRNGIICGLIISTVTDVAYFLSDSSFAVRCLAIGANILGGVVGPSCLLFRRGSMRSMHAWLRLALWLTLILVWNVVLLLGIGVMLIITTGLDGIQ